MIYPPRMTVIAPHIRCIDDESLTGTHGRLIFLESFATLTVTLDDSGIACFEERVDLDTDGTRSVPLLCGMTDRIDGDTVLAGFRLDHVMASLMRVPRDSMHEAAGREALLKLKLGLIRAPIDAWWLDRKPLDFLNGVAAEHGLPAEWDQPVNPLNPALCRRRLSARASTLWAAIVANRLPAGDQRRRIFAQFDRWRTAAAHA